MRLKKLFPLVSFLFILLHSFPALSLTAQRYQLDNGLTVIVQEDHNAPVVAIQAWVKVGSADEKEEEAGIAHVFEHMLFKGTKRRKVGQIAREIESSGGYINAWTSLDQTVYHLVIASRFLDTGIDIMADCLQNSSFDPAELEKEKEVILEEFKRSKDIPSNRLEEAFLRKAYSVHPYGRPVIGYEKTFRSLTRTQIIDFFHRWYVPNNIVLVAVGDFSSDEMLRKIKESFKDFKPNPNISHRRPHEPPQAQLRTLVLKEETQETHMKLGFHIPGLHHEDIYALDLIASILGEGETSRLYRNVKDKKGLVHSIYAYSFTPRDEGLFIVGATLEAEQGRQALEETLKEIYKLRDEKVTWEELQRAKRNLESSFIYAKETVQGRARKLGYYEAMLGDVSYEEKYLKKLFQVSPEDIQRVARKYFDNNNLTIGFMFPEEDKNAFDETVIRKIAEGVHKKIQKPPEVKSSQEIVKRELSNGIRVLIKEDHNVPIFSIIAVFLGGVRSETLENNGISNFMTSMWTKGTKRWTAQQIAEKIENISGSLNGFSGENSMGLSGRFLSKYFKEAFDIFSEVLLNPTFEKKEMEKKRKDIIAAIKRQKDDLTHEVFRLFSKNLYGNHPYAFDILGTEANVKKFTREDLLEYYRNFVRPENMVLAIVGDVDKIEALRMVSDRFGSLKKTGFVPPKPLPSIPLRGVKLVKEFREKNQAHIVLGYRGASIYDSDRYPLDVLSAVLSGQGGRLFLELRDKLGLAYALTSFSREGLEPGSWGIYIATSPEKIEEALDGIKTQLRKIREEGVTSEELERAKRYIVGNYEIGLQTNSSQATAMAFNELYGLGYEEYRRYPEKILAVKAQDVLAVAKKYIDLEGYLLAIIQPKVR